MAQLQLIKYLISYGSWNYLQMLKILCWQVCNYLRAHFIYTIMQQAEKCIDFHEEKTEIAAKEKWLDV